MWIIIEGCDGTGKTTLASHLEHVLGDVDQRHHSKPRTHPLLEYVKEYTSRHHVTVTDRHYLGETVYSNVWRGGKSEMTVAMRRWIELYLRSQGALLVHLTLPRDVVVARLRERGEDLLEEKDVQAVLDGFKQQTELARMHGMAVMSLRLPPQSGDVLTIVETAKKLELEALQLAGFETFIGHPVPDVLLLGDTRSEHPSYPRMPGCFAPWRGTSGEYLLRSLDESFFEIYNVAMANANDEPKLLELWKALNRPKVVRLGNRAADACDAAGVPGVTVRHPQYWRRFHHNLPGDYSDEIFNAAEEQE